MNPPQAPRILLASVASATVVVLTVLATFVALGGGSANAADPVLGSPSYLAPNGEGWGTAHPRHIFNGGDPAGDVSKIRWTGWGNPDAFGHGRIPLFRPGGGYYARPGRIVLRAQDLGTCSDGTYGYTRLYYRIAHKPNGPVGKHWHPWTGGTGNICDSAP